jgi:hypothetical protein
MGGSIELWKKYWDMTLNNNDLNHRSTTTPAERKAAQIRYQTYQQRINEAIQKDEQIEKDPQSKSPLVGWRQ